MTLIRRIKAEKAAFLQAYEANGDWKSASEAVGRSRNTTNGWRRQDPAFRAETDQVATLWRGTNGEKRCRSCGSVKPTKDFAFRSERQSYRSVCGDCRRAGQKQRYLKHQQNEWFKLRASRARSRSQFLKVPCDLNAEYLENIWTDHCPVSGVSMLRGEDRTHPHAAELDRLVPELGYIKGNVTFISRRMNLIKNSASLEELVRLGDWARVQLKNVAADVVVEEVNSASAAKPSSPPAGSTT